jgi:hypothetical protein
MDDEDLLQQAEEGFDADGNLLLDNVTPDERAELLRGIAPSPDQRRRRAARPSAQVCARPIAGWEPLEANDSHDAPLHTDEGTTHYRHVSVAD